MNYLLLLKTTIVMCRTRLTQSPASKPLLSIEKQLEYLIDLEEGRRSDFQLIANLNLGLLAARELEPHDMELANLIYDVTKAVKEKQNQ